MKMVVTGAAGFLGQELVAQLCRVAAPDTHIVLMDRIAPPATDARTEIVVGDLAEPRILDRVLDGADVVFHLAAMPGGAAEADYEGSCRANLTASLALLDRLRRRTTPPRLVYCSTIAVFGDPLPRMIDDDTQTRPTLTYGAHKLMVEVALANLTRLGLIQSFAVRLPGLLARPGRATGLRSAFMSDIFHAALQRQRYTVPVSRDGTVWAMSVGRAAENLIHAATMAAPDAPVAAFTLPALRVRMGELTDLVCQRCGADPGALMRYEADAALQAQFASLPPLTTGIADAMGFQHDGSLGALVDRVLGQLRAQSEAP